MNHLTESINDNTRTLIVMEREIDLINKIPKRASKMIDDDVQKLRHGDIKYLANDS